MKNKTLLHHHQPNQTTLTAMEECESGAELSKVDPSSLEAFIKSME